MQLLSSFLTTLFAVFVVVDPIPVAPMFAAMTAGRPSQEIRLTARRASVAGALLLLFFAVFGQLLFKLLRVDQFDSALERAAGITWFGDCTGHRADWPAPLRVESPRLQTAQDAVPKRPLRKSMNTRKRAER